MATIATYRVKVQAEVDDTSARAQTIIDNGLADVYQEIIRYIPELVGTTTNDRTATASLATYTPSAFLRIKSLHWKSTSGSNFNMLEEVTQDEYLINDVNASATENPSKYFVNGLGYQLVPAPDNAGTIRETYYAVQAELTGSQVSIIPDRFSKVMVLGGIARFYEYMRLPDAENYRNEFLGALEAMRTEIMNNSRKPKPTLYGKRRYAVRRV